MSNFPAYDESLTRDGVVNSVWQSMLTALDELPGGLERRRQRMLSHLAEDGLMFAPGDTPRFWQLDPVPFILPSEEWAFLSIALAQRANILEILLQDIYGSQTLLENGTIPPHLIFANPGFLRACQVKTADSAPTFLSLYAADLIRGGDGKWRVLADRTQAASGLGYALAHRRVLARTLPELYGNGQVRGIEGFFENWQLTLRASAPSQDDNPRMVLMTPGPVSSTYFESIYLARELGLTLVEGDDLAVRRNQLFFRALAGLQKIDVVLRRIEDSACDPLSLAAESLFGVPGLVEAARGGEITVSNGLGSGIVESPAFQKILPQLALDLTGKDLLLDSVPSWWGGDCEDAAYIENNRDSLYISDVFASLKKGTIGSQIDSTLLRSAPQNFVARAPLAASLTPSWQDNKFETKPFILRIFLVATKDGYVTLPGGFARLAEDTNPFSLAIHRNGTAKDVWVQAVKSQSSPVLSSAEIAPLVPRRTSGELQSRLAENLYWLGRYLERIDITQRCHRALLMRLVHANTSVEDIAELEALERCLEACGILPRPIVMTDFSRTDLAQRMQQATKPGSIIDFMIANLSRIGNAVRDRLSNDMARAIARIVSQGKVLSATNGDIDAAIMAIEELIRLSASVGGLAAENMTRGSGWRFFDLGRRMERAANVNSMIAAITKSPIDFLDGHLKLILELCDSAITYRTRYRAAVQLLPVMDLVLSDDSNPRSIGYQLSIMANHIQSLPETGRADLLDAVTHLMRTVHLTVQNLGERNMDTLPGFLQDIRQELTALSDLIGERYFTHIAIVST